MITISKINITERQGHVNRNILFLCTGFVPMNHIFNFRGSLFMQYHGNQ